MARTKRIFREWQHPRASDGRFARKGSPEWVKAAAEKFRNADEALKRGTSAPGHRAEGGRPRIARGAKAEAVFAQHAPERRTNLAPHQPTEGPARPSAKKARPSTFELGPKSKSSSGADKAPEKRMPAPGVRKPRTRDEATTTHGIHAGAAEDFAKVKREGTLRQRMAAADKAIEDAKQERIDTWRDSRKTDGMASSADAAKVAADIREAIIKRQRAGGNQVTPGGDYVNVHELRADLKALGYSNDQQDAGFEQLLNDPTFTASPWAHAPTRNDAERRGRPIVVGGENRHIVNILNEPGGQPIGSESERRRKRQDAQMAAEDAAYEAAQASDSNPADARKALGLDEPASGSMANIQATTDAIRGTGSGATNYESMNRTTLNILAGQAKIPLRDRRGKSNDELAAMLHAKDEENRAKKVKALNPGGEGSPSAQHVKHTTATPGGGERPIGEIDDLMRAKGFDPTEFTEAQRRDWLATQEEHFGPVKTADPAASAEVKRLRDKIRSIELANEFANVHGDTSNLDEDEAARAKKAAKQEMKNLRAQLLRAEQAETASAKPKADTRTKFALHNRRAPFADAELPPDRGIRKPAAGGKAPDGVRPTDGRPDVAALLKMQGRSHDYDLGNSRGRDRSAAPDMVRAGNGFMDGQPASAEIKNPVDGTGDYRYRIYNDQTGATLEEGTGRDLADVKAKVDRMYSSQRGGGMARTAGNEVHYEARSVERKKDSSRGDFGKGPFYDHQVVEVRKDGTEHVKVKTSSADRAAAQAADMNAKEGVIPPVVKVPTAGGDAKLAKLTDEQLTNGLRMRGTQSPEGKRLQAEAERRGLLRPKGDAAGAAASARWIDKTTGREVTNPGQVGIVRGDIVKADSDAGKAAVAKREARKTQLDTSRDKSQTGGVSKSPTTEANMSGFNADKTDDQAAAESKTRRDAIRAQVDAATNETEVRAATRGLSKAQLLRLNHDMGGQATEGSSEVTIRRAVISMALENHARRTSSKPGEPQLGVTESSKGRTTTVTLPDGTTAQRTSKTMTYSHAVVATVDNRAEARDNRKAADRIDEYVTALEQWIADGSDMSKLNKFYTGGGSLRDAEAGIKHYGYYLPGFEPQKETTKRGTVYYRATLTGRPVEYRDLFRDGTPVPIEPGYEKYHGAEAHQSALNNARGDVARLRQKAAGLDAGPEYSYHVPRWSQRADTAFASIGTPEVSGRNTTFQVLTVGGVAKPPTEAVKHVPTAEEKAAVKEAAKADAAARKAESDRKFVEERVGQIEQALARGDENPGSALQFTTEQALVFLAKQVGAKVPRREKGGSGQSFPHDRDMLRGLIVKAVRERLGKA